MSTHRSALAPSTERSPLPGRHPPHPRPPGCPAAGPCAPRRTWGDPANRKPRPSASTGAWRPPGTEASQPEQPVAEGFDSAQHVRSSWTPWRVAAGHRSRPPRGGEGEPPHQHTHARDHPDSAVANPTPRVGSFSRELQPTARSLLYTAAASTFPSAFAEWASISFGVVEITRPSLQLLLQTSPPSI